MAMPISSLTAPSAVMDLGLGGSLTPEEEELRKRKAMASANPMMGPMADLGLSTAATTLLGSRKNPASSY